MAENEHGSGPAKRPRSGPAGGFGGPCGAAGDWVTPSLPRPKKPAVAVPVLVVPAPLGVYKTEAEAWDGGSSIPYCPSPHVFKTTIPIPPGASAAEEAKLMGAVPGAAPARVGERHELVGVDHPRLEESEFLVRKMARGRTPGTVELHWHDHATTTVLTKAKAKSLLGGELYARHAAALAPASARKCAPPTEFETLLALSLQEAIRRDQALLERHRHLTVACVNKLTDKPKSTALTQVAFEKSCRTLSFPSVPPHVALAFIGDGPSEASVADRIVGKPSPVQHGGNLLPRVALRIRRLFLTLIHAVDWLGIHTVIGDGHNDIFGFLAPVAKITSPFSPYHPAYQACCKKGKHPLVTTTAAPVSNPDEFESEAATQFNANAGGGYVALLDEHPELIGGESFFRVLLPAAASSVEDCGYVNLLGRAIVRGRLGWVPVSTLDITAATTALYTESYGGEAGTPLPDTLTVKFRCWTVAKPNLVPTPC